MSFGSVYLMLLSTWNYEYALQSQSVKTKIVSENDQEICAVMIRYDKMLGLSLVWNRCLKGSHLKEAN